MSRSKNVLVAGLILGLGGLCYYLNKDSFGKRPIQISYRVSPWLKDSPRAKARGASDAGIPVVFTLDRYYRLKEVKVFKADEIATNKYAHPLWCLTTPSNSTAMASFSYGQHLPGMHPAVKGQRADPLEPYVMYRLVVKTIDDEAQHDFTTTPLPPPAEGARAEAK